jgi:hypothetical protein
VARCLHATPKVLEAKCHFYPHIYYNRSPLEKGSTVKLPHTVTYSAHCSPLQILVNPIHSSQQPPLLCPHRLQPGKRVCRPPLASAAEEALRLRRRPPRSSPGFLDSWRWLLVGNRRLGPQPDLNEKVTYRLPPLTLQSIWRGTVVEAPVPDLGICKGRPVLQPEEPALAPSAAAGMLGGDALHSSRGETVKGLFSIWFICFDRRVLYLYSFG